MLDFLETPGDIKRFLEIMRIFLKYGWESALEVKRMKQKFPFVSRLEGSRVGGDQIPNPVKLRKIFEELGPTFIKFGQMLSTRPDLIKEEFIIELKKLQDQAPPFDYVEVREIIKRELGRTVETMYKKFDKLPVAAASLGQVHLAELKNRKKVAVKVQRPDIEHLIAEDMRIISFIAGLVEKSVKIAHYYNPKSIAQEFAETIQKELDYNKEGKNAERFAANFKGSREVKIPKVYWNQTSKRVITLERVHGKKISKYYRHKNKTLKKKIASKYIDCFFKQMLIDGIFQADPHPANIFVSVHKGNPIISLVDFGMIGRIDSELRDNFGIALVLLVDKNVKGLVKQMQAMKLIDRIDDEQQFTMDVEEIIDYFYDTDNERIDFAGFGNALIRVMVRHKIKVPKQYILLLRSAGIAQDTVMQLSSDINFVERAKPYAMKIIEERTKPEYIMRNFRNNYFEFQRFLTQLPESIMKIFKKMEEEDFKVSIEADTLDELGKDLSRSSNTMGMSIIVAALILASALLLNSNIETAIGSTVDIGSVGFIGALVMGLLVVLKILNA
jgi:ubiquinone biosynthesis protein